MPQPAAWRSSPLCGGLGTEPRRLFVNWIERGGPTVTPPWRTGFGHIVFERLVTKSLNGSVAIDFARQGLIWKLSIPTTNPVTEPTIVRNRSAIKSDAEPALRSVRRRSRR
jgi:hypothetical protein